MELDHTNPLHNLYCFATAYEKEREFLDEWIRDGASISSQGKKDKNPLMEYFGDTWGIQGEQTSKPTDKDNIEGFSYFKVLAVVSDMLQEKCREYLKTGGTPVRFVYPPAAINADGQQINDAQQAKDRCRECIGWLLDTLAGDLGGASAVDEVAEETADTAANRNFYLKALARMMDIEHECFKEQIAFLNKAL